MANNVILQGFYSLANNLVSSVNLENTRVNINSHTGTKSITGERDGFQYSMILQEFDDGVVQIQSRFDTSGGRHARIQQAKALGAKGYKQQEIAGMLGISQASVSIYLRS